MINSFLPPLADLDEETRLKLANYLRDRNEYLDASRKLNELRIKMLIDGTPASAEHVNDYASTVVAPLRAGVSRQMTELLKRSVDLEGLKSMMPMVLMGLMRSVNLRLLLTVFDLEPDIVERMVTKIKNYIKLD